MRAYRDDHHAQSVKQRPGRAAVPSAAAGILALQRMVGNAEVARSITRAIPVQRAVTLQSDDGASVLTDRDVCDLLVEEGGSAIPFAVVGLMSQENAIGDSHALYARAQQLAATAEPEPTIEDYFASVVQQRSAQASTQAAVWEVEYDQIARLLADTRVNVDQDDLEHVQDEGIATSGLATCVAVGLTARRGPTRYSALAHWSTITSPRSLFRTIEDSFTGDQDDWPRLNQMDSVKYFAVGGSRDSMKEQAELLEYMIRTGRTTAGVKMVNDEHLRDRGKIVVIDNAGHIFYGVTPD